MSYVNFPFANFCYFVEVGPLYHCAKIQPIPYVTDFFGLFTFFGLSFFGADFATKFCDSKFQAQYLAKEKQHAAEICSVC